MKLADKFLNNRNRNWVLQQASRAAEQSAEGLQTKYSMYERLHILKSDVGLAGRIS